MRRLVLAVVLAGLAAAPAAADDALLAAVKAGDHAALRSLLAAHADPNRPLPDSSRVLSWAVDREDGEAVRLLLAAGARPNAADQDGATPLILACETGAPDALIAQLLDAHADPRPVRWDGVGALELCAKTASPKALERLIAAGAAPDAPDAKGQTPLMWAAAAGRADNFALLLRHGADVNRASKKGFTALFFAIKSGAPGMAQAVLDAGGDGNHVAPDGTTALQLAIYQQDFALAAALAENGADLKAWDENGNTPLQAAAIAGADNLVKVLLAKGADPNALTIPSKVNWQKEPNSNTPVPKFVAMPSLLLAAQNGNATTMKLLVAGGADSHFRAEDGTNVLLAAATGGRLDALAYAFELAPDPTVHTNFDVADNDKGYSITSGNDVMHSILYNRRVMITGQHAPDTVAMMKLAADKGAPLDKVNNRGQTLANLILRSGDDTLKAAFSDILKTHGKDAQAALSAEVIATQ